MQQKYRNNFLPWWEFKFPTPQLAVKHVKHLSCTHRHMHLASVRSVYLLQLNWLGVRWSKNLKTCSAVVGISTPNLSVDRPESRVIVIMKHYHVAVIRQLEKYTAAAVMDFFSALTSTSSEPVLILHCWLYDIGLVPDIIDKFRLFRYFVTIAPGCTM